MTQPTQVQIEAADTERYIAWLRKLAAEGGKGLCGNVDARSLDRIADKLTALAAAAEAGPIDHPNSFAEAQAKIVRLNREIAELQATTIERCAQVAELELQRHPIDGATVERIMRIIAAIRAMKKET